MNIKNYISTSKLLTGTLLLLIIFSFSPFLSAQERWNREITEPASKDNKKSEARRGDPLFPFFLRSYQKNVSPKQGQKCPASPSCSNYTLTAMRKYGFTAGFIMGMDRMYFRENFDMKYLKHYRQVVLKNNTTRVYDPVEANYVFSKKSWSIINPPGAAGGLAR
jgi:putative component of membrane protein insertase Oxa1/YidC/SpoIIIJ protein YidD